MFVGMVELTILLSVTVLMVSTLHQTVSLDHRIIMVQAFSNGRQVSLVAFAICFELSLIFDDVFKDWCDLLVLYQATG